MEDAKRCNVIEWDLNEIGNVVCASDKFSFSNF